MKLRTLKCSRDRDYNVRGEADREEETLGKFNCYFLQYRGTLKRR